MNTISPIFLVPIFTFFLNGEDKTIDPNFDNRLEVAEIVSDSVVGSWDEFTNKSLPFDEFKQKKGLQYISADGEERCAWHFSKEIKATINESNFISDSYKQELLKEIKQAQQKRSTI